MEEMNYFASMEFGVDKKMSLIDQLRFPDEEIRRLAVVGLAAYPLADVKEHILASLGDESWRVRKEAVDALLSGTIDNGIVSRLVGLLGAHDNAGLRNSSVEALEKLGSRAIPSLTLHLHDDDHDIRKFVIDIMGNIGNADVVPQLIEALDDPDPNVSAAAAENLGKLADPRALPHLVSSLQKNDIWFRFTLLEALGNIGKPVPIELIAPLAEENILKKAVFDCLGAIGAESATSLLLDGIKGKARNARDAAVLALLRIRDRLTAEAAAYHVDMHLRRLKGSPYVAGLLASLDSADSELQESLVRILGIIGDERAVGKLLHVCRDERLRQRCLLALGNTGEAGSTALLDAFPLADEQERCFIAYVCGELRNTACAAILREGMGSDNPELRRISATAAGKIGLTALVDELSGLLEDDVPEVRDGVIAALSRMATEGRDGVLKVAVTLSGAHSPEKRRSAAMLFAALHDAEKLSLLVKDEEALVRKAAITSLAQLKSAAAVSALVMALADEDADVRSATAAALGEIGGDEVLAPLLLALNDEDSWVKCAALRSLGKTRNKKALSAVIRLLENSEGLELITAMATVAAIGGDHVLSHIKKGLENQDEEVVKSAIDILIRDGDGWIDEYGEKLLSHCHWDVRRSFVNALAEQRGVRALPRLQSALAAESDLLVKDTITSAIDRLR
jgi:HEAT repeat protein